MKTYTGVEWSRKEQCWKSYIFLNGKKHLVGIFQDQVLAVKARDTAILKNGLNSPLQILKPLNKKDDKIERT